MTDGPIALQELCSWDSADYPCTAANTCQLDLN